MEPDARQPQAQGGVAICSSSIVYDADAAGVHGWPSRHLECCSWCDFPMTHSMHKSFLRNQPGSTKAQAC